MGIDAARKADAWAMPLATGITQMSLGEPALYATRLPSADK